MRKINRKTAVCTLAIMVLFAIGVLNVPSNKTRIILKLWQDDFQDTSIMTLESGVTDEMLHGIRLDGVFKNRNYGNDGREIVQYTVKAYGLPSAGAYYGFYYSPDDVPAAYQNVRCKLNDDGNNHWSWSKDGGRGSTYKICDKFYYYAAYF